MKCTFCPNPIDDSDEHIIPNALNGRLHSKRIICSSCNKLFGENLEPAITNLFKPIIHILDLKNARALQATDSEGNKYILKNLKTKPVKPFINFKRKGDEIHFSISGEKKQIEDYLLKRSARSKTKIDDSQLTLKDFKMEENSMNIPELTIAFNFKINKRVKLELYKIALEFFALNNLDLNLINPLLKKMRNLDENLNEILFCNLTGEIRTVDLKEVSHLIVLKHHKESKKIICYIELFNILCAVIPLVNNYEGEGFSYSYFQDAITGERLDNPPNPTINLDYISQCKEYSNNEFGLLTNLMVERHRTRAFEENINNIISNIHKPYKQKFEEGRITEEEYKNGFIKESTSTIAHKSIEYPYSVIDDESTEHDDLIDYLHSNIKEEYYEEFINKNSQLSGLGFIYNQKEYYLEKFISHPFAVKKGSRILKVYCVLNNSSDIRVYLPFRIIFEGINNYNSERKE
jgi:hypothetical protein